MKKHTKVLVICQHYWPETFRVTDLSEGFVEYGYKVDVLCGIPNYPAGKFFKGYGLFNKRKQTHNGVNIIRVPEIPRGKNTNFRIALNYLSFTFFAIFYIPKLYRQHYDRIFVYELSPVFMILPGIILAKLQKIKLYVYVCDFWPHSLFSIIDIKNKFLRKIITKNSYWYYRQADGIMAVFKGIQTRLVKNVGISKEKTLYTPQAAEKFYEKPVYDKALKKRFEDKFKIVFAGNINPAQSFETILAAAEILKKKNYNKICFIIVGDGMSRKWLEAEVKKLGLDEYFSFEGLKPTERIPAYQTIADLLVVALSKSKLFEYGIPAKVQSYMASGKPIVGAMDGEAQKLINESGCGYCVSSGDSKGLAKAIEKLINMSTSERSIMGNKGRKYHFMHFERDYNLKRVVEFVFNNNRIDDKEYDY